VVKIITHLKNATILFSQYLILKVSDESIKKRLKKVKKKSLKTQILVWKPVEGFNLRIFDLDLSP
jgi:hypothetical protein